jgi:hypothetical protein
MAHAPAMGDRRRRGAIVTGLVLAAMALGIYLVVILKYAAGG